MLYDICVDASLCNTQSYDTVQYSTILYHLEYKSKQNSTNAGESILDYAALQWTYLGQQPQRQIPLLALVTDTWHGIGRFGHRIAIAIIITITVLIISCHVGGSSISIGIGIGISINTINSICNSTVTTNV